MRAAVFEREGVLKIKDVAMPAIREPDELLAEVEVCSVCGTDVHMTNVPPGYAARPGTILGHELVGKVIKTGEKVKKLKVGDRFVVNPNVYCGVCEYCQLNLPNQCENLIYMGIEENGGFAEYIRLPERAAFKIPDDMPIAVAAFAEPLACAVNALQKIRVNLCESVAVIGAGPIGLLFIQLVKSMGASPVISLEPNAVRREYALRCGADYAINPLEINAAAFVKEKTGLGADFAIDVVGSQMVQAIDCIRKNGTVLLFGNNAKAEPKVAQSQITYKEAKILGTWLANASFPQAIKILQSGKLKLDFLITHTFPLEKTWEAIEVMRSGEGIEVLVGPKLKV